MNTTTKSDKRNRLQSGEEVKALVFKLSNNEICNIDVTSMDFSDMKNPSMFQARLNNTFLCVIVARYPVVVHINKVFWERQTFKERVESHRILHPERYFGDLT